MRRITLAVAAPDTPGAQAEAAPPPHRRRGTGGWGVALGIAAIVLVLAGLAAGYSRWTAMRQELSALDARLAQGIAAQDQLRAAVAQAEATVKAQEKILADQESRLHAGLAAQQQAAQTQEAALQAREQQLADEQVRLQEREGQLREAVADVYRRIGSSGNQWMVAEAEYLIRLAGHRLTLARDVLTARAALELADQRLSDTRDPGWTGVREQLARDIATLAAVELPDLEGLSARLAALVEQVPKLTLAGAERTLEPHDTTPAGIQRPPEERSWETLWGDFWSGLKDSVRIRRNDQPVQAMLPPEQQFFLYQNLELQLEIARLALLRGEAELYRGSLATARQWLRDYFDDTDAATRSMTQALTELAAVDVRPELPDIGRALRALKAREHLLRDLTRPAAPVEAPSAPAAEQAG